MLRSHRSDVSRASLIEQRSLLSGNDRGSGKAGVHVHDDSLHRLQEHVLGAGSGTHLDGVAFQHETDHAQALGGPGRVRDEGAGSTEELGLLVGLQALTPLHVVAAGGLHLSLVRGHLGVVDRPDLKQRLLEHQGVVRRVGGRVAAVRQVAASGAAVEARVLVDVIDDSPEVREKCICLRLVQKPALIDVRGLGQGVRARLERARGKELTEQEDCTDQRKDVQSEHLQPIEDIPNRGDDAGGAEAEVTQYLGVPTLGGLGRLLAGERVALVADADVLGVLGRRHEVHLHGVDE